MVLEGEAGQVGSEGEVQQRARKKKGRRRGTLDPKRAAKRWNPKGEAKETKRLRKSGILGAEASEIEIDLMFCEV